MSTISVNLQLVPIESLARKEKSATTAQTTKQHLFKTLAVVSGGSGGGGGGEHGKDQSQICTIFGNIAGRSTNCSRMNRTNNDTRIEFVRIIVMNIGPAMPLLIHYIRIAIVIISTSTNSATTITFTTSPTTSITITFAFLVVIVLQLLSGLFTSEVGLGNRKRDCAP